MNVQNACLLLTASLIAIPAYAQRAVDRTPFREPTISNAGQGAGSAPVAPISSRQAGPSAGGPPPGAGVAEVSAPPPPRQPPVPPPAAPMPVKPPVVKPSAIDPQAGPGPGRGPEKPIPQGAGPAAPTVTSNAVLPPEPPRIAMPGGATQGAAPAAEARVANSATTPANTNNGSALAAAPSLVDKPPSAYNPPGGSGPELFPNFVNQPSTANTVKPPTKPGILQGSGTSVGVTNNSAYRVGGGLGEILPGSQKLSESMQEQAALVKATDTSVAVTSLQTKCTAVSLRPDARRQAMSLVDLLGDGLIVAAVPDTHIQSVFTRAGYASVDLSKSARWCVTPSAARELLQPARGTGGQDASLLVRTGGGLQLMSQDQWLAHQASLKPLVASMSAKPARSGKLAKVSGRTLAKPTAKSSAGITVGSLRLPTGANKVMGTAS